MNRNIRLLLLASALVTLAGWGFEARAQRPGAPSNPTRDMVRAINRQEMDQLLHLKLLPAVKNEPARRLMLKQISDDFRDMQNLNNRMMRETWSRETVDYGFVSNMITQIRGKASRLKNNLNLPQPADSKNERRDQANETEFRAALLILDQTIMRFIKNPVFQATNKIEMSQATQARQDLERVIQLATDIRNAALRLGKIRSR